MKEHSQHMTKICDLERLGENPLHLEGTLPGGVILSVAENPSGSFTLAIEHHKPAKEKP